MSVILFLCSNRWNSAITEYCLNSAEALLEGKSSVHLIARRDSPCYKRAESLKLTGLYALDGFGLTHFFAVRNLIKDLRPDVIYTFGGPESSMAQFIAKSLAIHPVMLRFRGQDMKKRYILGLDHGFHGVVFPSLRLEEKYKSQSKKMSKTIPLATNGKRFFREKSDDSAPYILSVGRFDPIKGYQMLFKLFSALRGRLPLGVQKPKLFILGREENLSTKDLIRFAEANHLTIDQDYIIETSYKHDIHKLMSGAVCGFVSSFGSEIICRVSQEFLCCGTPIIVSGVGSLEESLFEAGCGISYRGLDESETVVQLADFYMQICKETATKKLERSIRALLHFGYEQHREKLNEFIDQAKP